MRAFKSYLVLAVFILSGCKNALLIDRNESSLQDKPSALKIICIDPRVYFDDEEENYDLNQLRSVTAELRAYIVKFSRRNKIQLELFNLDEKATASYYYNLLNLKRNMLAANFNQSSPLDLTSHYKTNEIQKKVFVYAPKILYDFNSLSKEYGTPYFSYMGIYVMEDRLVLYHIVVNTDLGETIYRERKIVRSALKKSTLSQMVYDSYALLRKELITK